MKGLTPVLLLSVAANLALGALLLTRRTSADTIFAAESAPTTPGTISASPGNATKAAAPGPASPQASPADVDYLARLRASGMPADVIRDLLFRQIQARYRDRLRTLLPQDADKYWLSWTQTGLQGASPEVRAKYREIYKEIEAEIRALLGDGPEALDSYQRRLYDQLAGTLANPKIQQVEAIRRDYDEMAANVRTQAKGLVLKADREQLRLLERERRRDLEAVLSPEELLEYDLRTSPTANGLRYRLTHFEPSEQEFRALAQLQLKLDQQFGTSNLSAEEQDRRRAAEKDQTAQIQAVLGADRYNDYLVTIDGMFSETSSFASAYNLGPTAAKEIVALKQQTWKRIDELDRTGITGDPRSAALKALEQEVASRLTTRLGADVFAKYQKSGATWLNRLRHTPPKP